MKKSQIILIIALFSFGCKFNLELNPDEYLKNRKPIPIVYCLFSNDSIFKIQVYKLNSVFDSTQTTYLDAKVYILDQYNDTIKCFRKSDSIFVSTQEIGRAHV